MWDRRISIIWWLVGVAVLMAWIVAFYPALRDSTELQNFIDQFPAEALAFFGIDPATYQTGFGCLQAQLYSFIAPLLLIAFTATAGAAATAGEEEQGTIDLLLAVPVTRTRVILEKYAALAVQTTAIVLVMVVVLVISNPILDLKLSVQGIIGINVGVLLLGLVFGALAMLIGAWRGKRATAAGAVIGVGLIAFLINSFAPLVEELEGLQRATPFFWYLEGDPLLEGPTPLHFVLLFAVVVVMAAAVVVFRRADLGARQPLFTPSGRDREAPSSAVSSRPGGAAPTSLYGKTLWDRRKTIWWWLLAIGGTAALTIAFWPTIDTRGDAMQGLMESIPPELLAMFGITDAASLLTPEGFLSARLYSSLGTTLMLVFTIASGTRAVAGEEAKGTLDLLIGLPVRRSRVVTDRTGGLVTLVALLMIGLTLTVLAGGAIVEMGLTLEHVAASNVGLGLLALFFGTMALALGGWTGRTGVATGGTAAVALAAFLLNGLGAAIDGLEPFRIVSPFYWYLGDSPPLARGLTSSYWLMLAGVVLFTAMAVPGFLRRDIAS
jgi:ABC-2 type transport system permease protein